MPKPLWGIFLQTPFASSPPCHPVSVPSFPSPHPSYFKRSRLKAGYLHGDVLATSVLGRAQHGPCAGFSYGEWRSAIAEERGRSCWGWARPGLAVGMLKPVSCFSLGSLISLLQAVCMLGKHDSVGSDFTYSRVWGAAESSLLTCFSQGMASSVGNSPEEMYGLTFSRVASKPVESAKTFVGVWKHFRGW